MQKHHPLQNDDPRVISLDRGNYTTCTVILKGACITSWRIEQIEQIFVSRSSKLDDYSEYRGGISLVFPHFGDWNFGREHGFARDLMWSLKRGPNYTPKGDVYLELYLTSNDFTRSCWNFDFELRYSIFLRTNQLETRMAVINKGLEHFEFHFEQHSYLKVADLSKCIIHDLKDCLYINRSDGVNVPYSKQKEEDFKVDPPMERIFRDSPPLIRITSHGDKKQIVVTRSNLPDLNIFNPGLKNDIEDLDDDEANNFIVVDSGNVCQKRVLAPTSFWTAQQSFEIVCLEQSHSTTKDFYDYFEACC